MNKKDGIEKIVFVFCVTILGILFAFFKFEDAEVVKKCDIYYIVAAVIGFAFLVIIAIVLFFCCKENNCNVNIVPFSKDFSADKLNKYYFVDENNKSIPGDRTIIFVKNGVDFNKLKFFYPEKIEEIHFCDYKISVTTEKLRELTNAKIFFDNGNCKIKIVHIK